MYYVYFLRNGRRGAIKVGHAKNVSSRIAALQTGNPTELQLLAAIPISSKKQAENIEKWMHNRFKKQHIRGEWFASNIKLKIVFDSIQKLELSETLSSYKEVRGILGRN